ncbi:hypothetical protein [Bacterioplanoides sp. SCSIO 12839]|uniref:hypothetical protein n=1 Tax=Bacterioplanoides sp. SCSIO 12839 TaxID=2829569 RepID=UPI00210596D7|nr:hypothetical protein [Bacterioplanoides sp. SCSIO 12839]UTW47429.1 hypothetical protein KFF03_12705 [Bacterioplanoides sp. SCSIO 12839]
MLNRHRGLPLTKIKILVHFVFVSPGRLVAGMMGEHENQAASIDIGWLMQFLLLATINSVLIRAVHTVVKKRTALKLLLF